MNNNMNSNMTIEEELNSVKDTQQKLVNEYNIFYDKFIQISRILADQITAIQLRIENLEQIKLN